jgi:N-acetylmuramoyl-L-alanine amidase
MSTSLAIYNRQRNHSLPLTSPPRYITAILPLVLLAIHPTHLSAQQPTARTVIILDPAHGGPEAGARIDDHLVEKDFTLAFASRLRALITASGVTVISTRDSDPSVSFTTDQRAEIANHAHPTACLILHATASGNGIHVVISDLAPPDDLEAAHGIVSWDTAQTASLPQSLSLANELGVALLRAKLPVILTRASVRPLDNLTCPAVAIEVAPLTVSDSKPTPVTDAAYQQRIGQAIAQAIVSWRAHNSPSAGAAR